MSMHLQFGLTRVINARGTFTPLGVSRSSAHVGRVVAQALGEFFILDELQSLLSRKVAALTGAEAGAATHCAAAGITLAVAGAMTGSHPARIASLPDSSGMSDRVVVPACHAVNYGHPLLTDVRLAGATPVLAGSEALCTLRDIEAALAHPRTACLLLVCSRLVRGQPVDLEAAVALAHRRGVPAILDGAAQDLRMAELLATGADLVLFSAHKYLAAPTAGLIVGRADLVQACRDQERGIGRAMKATKEGILGLLAALEERSRLDLDSWRIGQQEKVAWFTARADRIPGIRATAVGDPAGLPFSRACLTIEPKGGHWNAVVLAQKLRAGRPSIWLMEHEANDGRLTLELVPLLQEEMQEIIDRVAELVQASGR